MPDVVARLDDGSPLVRGAAIWAASQLLNAEEFALLEKERSLNEKDDAVYAEWEAGLKR
jgi:epoxyqueuosine reductase